MMNSIKDDLICEIIRVSQTNLLGKKGPVEDQGSGMDDPGILDWIKNNAANYRKHFIARLEEFNTTRLSDILKLLTESKKDLEDILEEVPVYSEKKTSERFG